MRLREIIAGVAEAWLDPDHPPRVEAAALTLEAPNRFTEEGIAFAVNQKMSRLTKRGLRDWLGERTAERRRTVGVLPAQRTPLDGLHDLLAVVLTGHHYVGRLSARSPYLLPAFAAAVREEHPFCARFSAKVDVLGGCEALIVDAPDDGEGGVDPASLRLPPERCLVRPARRGVAVLDGGESADEMEGLAEDVLLHDGAGSRAVALIWAPAGSPPDGLLEALALFRGVFPAHPDTAGMLELARAFLAARDEPHAYGDGLEFLLSKGEPAYQKPGHVRWVEYRALQEVAHWLASHEDDVELVATRDGGPVLTQGAWEGLQMGNAHRSGLACRPGGVDTVDFLVKL